MAVQHSISINPTRRMRQLIGLLYLVLIGLFLSAACIYWTADNTVQIDYYESLQEPVALFGEAWDEFDALSARYKNINSFEKLQVVSYEEIPRLDDLIEKIKVAESRILELNPPNEVDGEIQKEFLITMQEFRNMALTYRFALDSIVDGSSAWKDRAVETNDAIEEFNRRWTRSRSDLLSRSGE